MSNFSTILVADIGNTSILLGLFKKGRLVKKYRVSSGKLTAKELKKLTRHFPPAKIEAFVIASVVPQATRMLSNYVSKFFKLKAQIVGRDLMPPISNKYAKPKQVGIDRLMNAVAAFKKYKKEAIVIDFGTAITLDIVSKKGEYLGGVIAPGIEISMEALHSRTALLPKIRLSKPLSVIGRSTADSIRVGCSYGIGGLCDRLVAEIKKHCRFNPIVIATGGYATFMSNYCTSINRIAPNLTLEGIYLSAVSKLIKKR